MMEQGKPNEREVFYILRCYDLNWIEFVWAVTGKIDNNQLKVVENLPNSFAETFLNTIFQMVNAIWDKRIQFKNILEKKRKT